MATMENDKKKVVAVVGAGLVGSLEACLLAQRGMEVGSVGSLELSLPAEQVMDLWVVVLGMGLVHGVSGSMPAGTARNGGRVSGHNLWAYWSLAYQQSR
jgi:hypothetical protein